MNKKFWSVSRFSAKYFLTSTLLRTRPFHCQSLNVWKLTIRSSFALLPSKKRTPDRRRNGTVRTKKSAVTQAKHNNSAYSRDTELNIVLLCVLSSFIWVAFELRFHRVQVLLRFTTQVSKVTSRLRFHLPEQFGCIQGLDSNRCGHGIPSFISFVITARPLSCTPRPQVTEHDFHEDQRETLQWTLGAV